MNRSQSLYLKAIEAGQTTPLTLAAHDYEAARLAAFAAQGNAALDYPDWSRIFDRTQRELKQLDVKASPSEIAEKKAAKATSAVAPKQ